MGVVVGVVVVDVWFVFGVKRGFFALVAGLVFGGSVQAPALALIVVCLGAGGEHVEQALLPELEAVVDIVVGDGEVFFVEAARRAVEFRFGHEAGAGDGHVILRGDKAVEVAYRRARVALVAVPGRAVDAHDDPGVLDRIVRVIELGSDGADVRALAVGEQLAQEAGREDLDVVVEQQQVLAVCLARAEVVDGREVERPAVAQHAAARIARGKGRVKGFGVRVGRVVFEDQHLKIVISGVFIQTG